TCVTPVRSRTPPSARMWASASGTCLTSATTLINANLRSLESWMAVYDRVRLVDVAALAAPTARSQHTSGTGTALARSRRIPCHQGVGGLADNTSRWTLEIT